MKKILVLGAGRVSGPCVGYLLDQPGFQLTVADQRIEHASTVTGDHPRGRAIALDVDCQDPRPLIREHDIVVNLLPGQYLTDITRICVQEATDIIGASYGTPQMQRMHSTATESGTLMLMEVGLDPGIDHMMAVSKIAEIRSEGGVVEAYRSLCGAIPSHEANDNPFGYKFSWSPTGALGAAKRPARYLENGEAVVIPGEEAMRNYSFTHVRGAGWFEYYPNGNALPYRELYGIDGARDLYRGTYRFPGWCETLAAMIELGALDDTRMDLSGLTHRQLVARLMGVEGEDDPRGQLARHLGLPEYSAVLRRIEWLGLLDDTEVPQKEGSPRDVTADLMFERLVYGENECDMVVMTHEFVAAHPDGTRRRVTLTLVDHGEPGGDSSIARTTGLPIAIACKLALHGKIGLTGLQIPVHEQIYEPVLRELQAMGITSQETVEVLDAPGVH